MIRQVIQRISNPEASIESLQERRFWLQCERAYTWQPIYQTCGRLMAVELLTVVTHPLNPSQRLPPDRYFTEITVSYRMEVVKEQIDLLAQKADFFVEHDLLASVNIDGPTLIALRQQPKSCARLSVFLAAFRTGGTHPSAERFNLCLDV